MKHATLRAPRTGGLEPPADAIELHNSYLDQPREVVQVARRSAPDMHDQTGTDDHERSVRLSVNLSVESAETFKALIKRKGLTITEGIRRAIAVWKFVEDEIHNGNQMAVIERDGSIRKVVLL